MSDLKVNENLRLGISQSLWVWPLKTRKAFPDMEELKK